MLIHPLCVMGLAWLDVLLKPLIVLIDRISDEMKIFLQFSVYLFVVKGTLWAILRLFDCVHCTKLNFVLSHHTFAVPIGHLYEFIKVICLGNCQ